MSLLAMVLTTVAFSLAAAAFLTDYPRIPLLGGAVLVVVIGLAFRLSSGTIDFDQFVVGVVTGIVLLLVECGRAE